ncbi:MAG TPA: hypothetical protein VGC44_00340 [Longimicrobiales bacterium]
MQVPLATTTGWGPVQAPEGFKALRIQGRTTADPLVLARLFADFAAHPSMFPRVVDRVEIVDCDSVSLKARYRTKFDPKPGGITMVESLSSVKVAALGDRVEFTWGSDQVDSKFVNAVRGRLMIVTRRTATGTETLVDYVSTVRPRNAAKGLLLESQKSVLVNDARYVIDRLMALAMQRASPHSGTLAPSPLFSCRAAA